MGQVHLHPKLAVLLLLRLKLPHLHSKYESVNHVVWGLVLDDIAEYGCLTAVSCSMILQVALRKSI